MGSRIFTMRPQAVMSAPASDPRYGRLLAALRADENVEEARVDPNGEVCVVEATIEVSAPHDSSIDYVKSLAAAILNRAFEAVGLPERTRWIESDETEG